MALINCSECGNQMSDKAQSCPKCGAPNPNTSMQIPMGFSFNPCAWHSDAPAVSSCVTCGRAMCKKCVDSAPFTLNNKPQCNECSLQMLAENIAANKKTKAWSIIKLIFLLLFMSIGLMIYLSNPNDIMNAWIYAGLGGLPSALKTFVTRSAEEKWADEAMSRVNPSEGCFQQIVAFIIKIIFAFVFAPVAAIWFTIKNTIAIVKSSRAIKADQEDYNTIQSRMQEMEHPNEEATSHIGIELQMASQPHSYAPVQPENPEQQVAQNQELSDITYTQPVQTSQTIQASTVTSSYQAQTSPKQSNTLMIGIAIGTLTLVGLIVGYFMWYVPYAKDRDALRTYVGATNVFLRSSQIAGVDNNILERIAYGSEVITYEKGTEWSRVKVNDLEGYMASSFLLNQSDFELLNSVWGNEEAKENIATFRCRMAILDFYRQHEMSGGSTGWQIYAKETEGLPNTVTYPKLYEKNGKFANFFFIVKNNTTGNRRLAGYSFEDETEKPVFRFVIDVPEYGDIKRIRTYKGDMTIEFDNRKKVSFPYYHSSYDYEVKQPSDSTVTPVINGNITLLPGIEYWVEGIIGKEYPIKGSLRINTSNKLWFQYVINDGRKIEADDYGIYDNGKMVFDSGMEATITDKIEGLWGEYYLKPYLPLELHVTGYGLTGKQDTPPAPAPPIAPKIEDILTVTDEKTAQEPQAEEKKNTEAQIAYIPPVIEEEPEDDNQIYDKVEQMPRFPGGQSALMSFLSRNVKYPKVCQENGIQGRVIIQFVVNKDGNISDVSVYKGVNPYLDAEAIRVIKSMPKWTPGKQKGKYVNVKYTLPISFRLG